MQKIVNLMSSWLSLWISQHHPALKWPSHCICIWFFWAFKMFNVGHISSKAGADCGASAGSTRMNQSEKYVASSFPDVNFWLVSGHRKVHQSIERLHDRRERQERARLEAQGHDGVLLPRRNFEVPLPVVRRPARDRPQAVGLQHRGPPDASLSRMSPGFVAWQPDALSVTKSCFSRTKLRILFHPGFVHLIGFIFLA